MINVRTALLSYVIGCGVIAASQWTYYTFMPREHWFDYEAIRFVEHDNKRLWMQSILEVSRVVDLHFHDVLYCRKGKTFERYSQAETSAQDTEVGVKAPKWPYSARTPDVGTECFMRSVITAELPFGIEKSQKVRSTVFVIPKPS